MSRTASTPSRKRIENEKPNATRGGDALARQRAVDVDERGPHRGGVRADLRHRRAVADVVAQRGVLELGVEHEVRVAQAQRDLDELEVVEVGLLRQRVGAVAVARLVGLKRLREQHARRVDLAVAAVDRGVGGERRRGEREQRDEGQEADERPADDGGGGGRLHGGHKVRRP
jgi:hypothetical protein